MTQALVTSSVHQGRRIVRVTGEVDVNTGPKLRDHLLALVAGGEHDIVVDLSEVSFLDSSGLGVLVMVHKRIRTAGGALRLAGCQPEVVSIFHVTALDRVMEMYSTVEDAVRDSLNDPV
ncbi:MAG TPA: STAS domain-containing protein [Kineosporiaceae bacterium]|jgi:anti-sigma B factor antagonist|nr:STAS domain-containing protein [Kineosporiaceae bacterium]